MSSTVPTPEGKYLKAIVQREAMVNRGFLRSVMWSIFGFLESGIISFSCKHKVSLSLFVESIIHMTHIDFTIFFVRTSFLMHIKID